MKDKIIDLFSLIAKPYKDKEGGEKLDNIKKWLDERDIPNEYIAGIGKIVNKQENPRIILVSHIDLIKKFQKGFLENKTHEIILSKKGKELIQGALDNTITNAVALLIIESLLNNKITDIELLLTEGEEVGAIGMSNYLKAYEEKSKNTFFINLDVSNDGWKKNASIEYDKPSFYGIRHLLALLEDDEVHLTSDRVGDDIDAVNDADCFGLSFCLPTKDLIHSYENKASTESLCNYYIALEKLLLSFTYTEDLKETFSPYLFDKAIEFKDVQEFNDYIKENKKKIFKEEPTNLSPYEIEVLIESLTSFIFGKLDNKSEENKEKLQKFLENKISKNEDFFLGDLAAALKKEPYPFMKAKDILNILVDFNTVKKKENTYIFRR